MSQIIWSILGFIFAVSLLTAVHEFGHFWVARLCGIKVLRFSIGFGKPLFTWHDKHGTEYAFSSIPLGGYVKMLDESEGHVNDTEKHRAFNRKSVWQRMAVIVAGPLFNILFAVFLYWLVFLNGISSIAPVLGFVPNGSIADIAGLKSGQEIVEIDGRATKSWEQVSISLLPYLGEKGFVKVKATDKKNNSFVNSYTLDLSNWSVSNKQGDLLSSLGFEPFDPTPPIVGRIQPGSAAFDSGLEENDRIIAINDKAIDSRKSLIKFIRLNPDKEIRLKVLRGDDELNVPITPNSKMVAGGQKIGFIGVEFYPVKIPQEYIRISKFSIGDALREAINKTKEYSVLTLQFLYKLVVGKVSVEHIAGPISIAKYAGQTIHSGINYFLSFMALISISFGVLNMLPIPVLDGGHFVFCVIELFLGRPISERTLVKLRYFGIIMLTSLMLLAIINDVLRL